MSLKWACPLSDGKLGVKSTLLMRSAVGCMLATSFQMPSGCDIIFELARCSFVGAKWTWMTSLPEFLALKGRNKKAANVVGIVLREEQSANPFGGLRHVFSLSGFLGYIYSMQLEECVVV